jgi:uncharacterized membrane protein
MSVLILGLVLFLGVHSVRIFGDGLRTAAMQRLGAGGYKGLYTLLSLLGFALIVWGYGLARQQPVPLWAPQLWARHLAALLTLISLILLAAAYVPGNGIKSRVHHPMVLGVKVWAFAHLLANHTLADVALFGGFALWAVLNFRSARARDRATGTVYPSGRLGMTVLTVLVGTAAWVAIALWAHVRLFGVAPMG